MRFVLNKPIYNHINRKRNLFISNSIDKCVTTNLLKHLYVMCRSMVVKNGQLARLRGKRSQPLKWCYQRMLIIPYMDKVINEEVLMRVELTKPYVWN